MRHILFLNVSFSRYFANQAVKTPRRTESVSSAVSDSGKSDYFLEQKKEKEFLAGSSLGRTDVKSASQLNIGLTRRDPKILGRRVAEEIG